MKKKTRRTVGQQIIESLQEFVETLQKGGDIKASFRCREVEVEPNSKMADSKVVKATRKMLGASQTVFAKFLGVSAQAVREWEQDESPPSEIAKRFMDEIRLNPDYWRQRLRDVAKTKKRAQSSLAH